MGEWDRLLVVLYDSNHILDPYNFVQRYVYEKVITMWMLTVPGHVYIWSYETQVSSPKISLLLEYN